MEQTLKFKNGNFRIMLVGDPHEKPDDDSERDKAVISDYLRLQNTAAEELKPDLVVLMGDNAGAKTEEDLKKTIERITKPYSDRNIPFTFIIGNHDLECGIDDLGIQYDVYRTVKGCILPEADKISSSGDWNITVESENSKDKILNLYMIYSGNHAPKKYYSNYAFVNDSQIEWYENTAAKLKEETGKIVPAIVFQHIPVPEEFELLKETSFLSMLFDGVPGLNGKKGRFYTLKKGIGTVGYMGEAPCPPDYNNGQFSSWKKTGDVFAAFFGHDHMNDFIGQVDGITLGQCKLSGFRQYGDGLMQGVRIIDIKESNPRCIDTKMHYYRELLGTDCDSIHGSLKFFRDRTSVKLENGMKALGIAAAITSPFILHKIVHHKKHGK